MVQISIIGQFRPYGVYVVITTEYSLRIGRLYQMLLISVIRKVLQLQKRLINPILFQIICGVTSDVG
jgi:myosin-crossreactive antigen